MQVIGPTGPLACADAQPSPVGRDTYLHDQATGDLAARALDPQFEKFWFDHTAPPAVERPQATLV